MEGTSFRAAVLEARTTDGQATVYYRGKDGVRAVYDVSQEAEGALFLNGRLLTKEDMPETMPIPQSVSDARGPVYMLAKNIPTAEAVFRHHHVDVQSNWTTKPEGAGPC